ncbi:MAG TPA: AMP-binding protein [Terriglobales bacterium]|nr:AMP-binding protein [Terriglobales bacterium]
MQVEEFLEHSAERTPDKIALVCGARRLTYSEIERLSNQLAHALLERGVQRWDRIVVYAGNTVETATSIFAILKAGGVFVVVNPTTKPDKLAYILNNCRATVLITTERLLPLAAVAARETSHLHSVLVAGATRLPPPPDGQRWISLPTIMANQPIQRCPRKNIDLDLAALIYTSGSTGRPKGVMVTHLNIVSAATSITTYLKNTPDDVILNVLPLSFDYGLYQLLMAFKIGAALVLEQSFAYPHAILETLVRENVTGFPIVPTICSILLQLDLATYSFPNLRYITNTAAVLPAEHIRKLRKAFPRVTIFSMYGLTECKRVSYLPPDQIDIRPTSVGRGMPNEEVYIVDEQGSRVGPGAVGELVVRGSNVMKGYWELPEETDAVLRPGLLPGEKVLYTGDLFRSDDEGYLYFVGRKDDIIKTRGEKVSPREVEDVLYSHPQVAEAAVIGSPDEILGNAICAFVTLKPGASVAEQELLGFCADHLEDFMVPKRLYVRQELPKSANGKIAKRLLASEAAGEPVLQEA